MMIALPNADGSFTCTVFWPLEGPGEFAAFKTRRTSCSSLAPCTPTPSP